MDIIQEIKKRQEKIDANTERIFKLQQQNMKLREEIRKLQKGGVSYLTSPKPLTTPNKCGTI